jgi:enediyne biosynthesis protein E4
MVLHNEGNDHNHWITLQLIGTRSNRAAIGATVKAVDGTVILVDEVHSGGSYLSQNDLRIHFGLGDSLHVDRVEIRWPGGKKEVVQNLASDRFYVVREGTGNASPVDASSPKP